MGYEGQPEKVRILGIDYAVSVYPSKQRDSFGLCRHDTCAIEISDSNSEQYARSVLLHEILEALNYRLELGLEHDKITILEAGLIQIIRDNTQLVKFLEKVDD